MVLREEKRPCTLLWAFEGTVTLLLRVRSYKCNLFHSTQMISIVFPLSPVRELGYVWLLYLSFPWTYKQGQGTEIGGGYLWRFSKCVIFWGAFTILLNETYVAASMDHLTLSRSRVINFEFLLQPHQYILSLILQYGELDYS